MVIGLCGGGDANGSVREEERIAMLDNNEMNGDGRGDSLQQLRERRLQVIRERRLQTLDTVKRVLASKLWAKERPTAWEPKQLAPHLGWSVQMLYKVANPDAREHFPAYKLALLYRATQDVSLLRAIVSDTDDWSLTPRPKPQERTPPMQIYFALAKVLAEGADMSEKILRDEILTPAELDRLNEIVDRAQSLWESWRQLGIHSGHYPRPPQPEQRQQRES
jgi:hypothetical protein